MPRCCNEFTRSQILHRAAAEAGRGLPKIEPGMPLPAGTGLSRRSFVLRSVGLALTVYGGSKLNYLGLEEGVAYAQAPERVLVSVYVEGGLDNLSALAPVGDSNYATFRPTLAIAPDEGTPFTEDPQLHWHPAATSLSTLHAEGKLTVFPAIGYIGANQSHFTSRHFWEVGELDYGNKTGWLGRYLDHHGELDNPLQGVSLSGLLLPSLATGSVPVATVTEASEYTLPVIGAHGVTRDATYDAFGQLGGPDSVHPALADAREQTSRSSTLHQQLAGFSDEISPVTYPNDPLADRLAGLAAMIGEGLPIRCAAVQAHSSYDTHAAQKGSFNLNFSAATASLLAWQRDLEARGIADRVLTVVWSEFGRRPRENGSAGTDHGAAGLAFVLGTQASGAMVGEFPGLANLDPRDNLRSTSDFRGLYCSLLEDWMGVDAEPLIPGASSFDRPTILKAEAPLPVP